ncbi:MAG: tetratricopeptide repeat protein [Pseudanabaena sp. CRU_2_10]|nr:tetratricopeptide repeat protein [Pseudanabaena sp. CRU_2_10]
MEENSSSTEKTYQEIFQAGIFSFERGDYQGAIAQFQQALSGVNEKTQIGGEIQIWLANAYDAVGNSTEAIALCRRLKTIAIAMCVNPLITCWAYCPLPS